MDWSAPERRPSDVSGSVSACPRHRPSPLSSTTTLLRTRIASIFHRRLVPVDRSAVDRRSLVPFAPRSSLSSVPVKKDMPCCCPAYVARYNSTTWIGWSSALILNERFTRYSHVDRWSAVQLTSLCICLSLSLFLACSSHFCLIFFPPFNRFNDTRAFVRSYLVCLVVWYRL